MVHMSRRKSVFGLIEHCSTEVVLPWSNVNPQKKISREGSRITSSPPHSPGRKYYRVRHTDLKSLVEDDNTIDALDSHTNIIVWQIRDIN